MCNAPVGARGAVLRFESLRICSSRGLRCGRDGDSHSRALIQHPTNPTIRHLTRGEVLFLITMRHVDYLLIARLVDDTVLWGGPAQWVTSVGTGGGGPSGSWS